MRFVVKEASPESLPDLLKIAEETGMFLGEELGFFQARLELYFHALEVQEAPPEMLLAAWDNSQPANPPIGAVFIAPETMAQGVANLLFIGVLQEHRNKGIGGLLLNHFESFARSRGNRLGMIETGGNAMFAPAWELYRRAGYEQIARIPDYYADGLDKLIFWKRL
ncbi:MAG: N-acetyltransferase [Bryobacter sp.]|nr:N-acetyltransferase [Bryobacter sp.]